jgi:class 3 adenylate cyclase
MSGASVMGIPLHNELYDGWFDKFTGDGFLAYWTLEKRVQGTAMTEAEHDTYHERFVECMGEVVGVARATRDLYKDEVVDRFRHNSRNVPSGLGVRIGIDAGPAYLVEIAGDLIIVGPPVVGAVRMHTAAGANEIVANAYVGSALSAGRADAYAHLLVNPFREDRSTKEYVDGQEVYVLKDDPAFGVGGPD